MIEDPRGQWAHPGKNTRIPGNQITMKGVDYPVWAVPDVGEPVLMQPGQEYTFPGASYVDEYPMVEQGGEYETKELTDAEIKEYVKGGYIVEEELPKAQNGFNKIAFDDSTKLNKWSIDNESFFDKLAENKGLLGGSEKWEEKGLTPQSILDVWDRLTKLNGIEPKPIRKKYANLLDEHGVPKNSAVKIYKAPVVNTPKKLEKIKSRPAVKIPTTVEQDIPTRVLPEGYSYRQDDTRDGDINDYFKGNKRISREEFIKATDYAPTQFRERTVKIPEFEDGGGLPKAQRGIEPTRADSLFLLNNNKVIEAFQSSGWKKGKNEMLKGSGATKNNQGHSPSANWKEYYDFKVRGKKKDIQDEMDEYKTYPQGLVKKSGTMSDYYSDKGLFKGATDWLSGGGEDKDFAMQYIHPSIKPQFAGEINAPNDEIGAVHSYAYDDLAITPWDMLNESERKERVKKYGVIGTPLDPKKTQGTVRSKSSIVRERERDETEAKMKELKAAGLYDGPIKGRGAKDNVEWQEALAKYENKEVVSSTPKTLKKPKEIKEPKTPEGYTLKTGYRGRDGIYYGNKYLPTTSKGKTHPVPGAPTMQDYWIKYPNERPKDKDLVSKQIGGQLPKAQLGITGTLEPITLDDNPTDNMDPSGSGMNMDIEGIRNNLSPYIKDYIDYYNLQDAYFWEQNQENNKPKETYWNPNSVSNGGQIPKAKRGIAKLAKYIKPKPIPKPVSKILKQSTIDEFLNAGIAKSIDQSTIDKFLKGTSTGFKSDIDWENWVKYKEDFHNNPDVIKHLNEIEEVTKANKTWMKNADGSSFERTPEEFVIERSDLFKKAFPDIMKKDGKVMPLIHHSPNEFNSFDEAFNLSGVGMNKYGPGIYTVPKPYWDDHITQDVFNFGEGLGKKPILVNYGKNRYDLYTNDVGVNQFSKQDGNLLTGVRTEKIPRYRIDKHTAVIPYSNTVKSAKGNILFDTNNSNIYKALAPLMGIAGYDLLENKKEGGELSQDQDSTKGTFVNSKEHGVDTPVYVQVEEKKSPIHGTGVFSKDPISKGQSIGVSHIRKEFEKNGEMYQAAFPSKQIGGYNHSDQEPNVTEVDNGDHISLIAIRDIQPGEELLSNYDDSEIQDMERSSDFIRKDVPKAKDGHIVKQRRGVRENPDGSVSSHLMKAEYVDGRGWVAFPSLFQDSKPYADDQENWNEVSEEDGWWPIYQEAVRRGEVYDFGEDKEAALAFGRGSWKDQLPEHLQDKQKGSFQLELTPEEIDKYVKGGYVVEELPKAKNGKTIKALDATNKYFKKILTGDEIEKLKGVYSYLNKNNANIINRLPQLREANDLIKLWASDKNQIALKKGTGMIYPNLELVSDKSKIFFTPYHDKSSRQYMDLEFDSEKLLKRLQEQQELIKLGESHLNNYHKIGNDYPITRIPIETNYGKDFTFRTNKQGFVESPLPHFYHGVGHPSSNFNLENLEFDRNKIDRDKLKGWTDTGNKHIREAGDGEYGLFGSMNLNTWRDPALKYSSRDRAIFDFVKDPSKRPDDFGILKKIDLSPNAKFVSVNTPYVKEALKDINYANSYNRLQVSGRNRGMTPQKAATLKSKWDIDGIIDTDWGELAVFNPDAITGVSDTEFKLFDYIDPITGLLNQNIDTAARINDNLINNHSANFITPYRNMLSSLKNRYDAIPNYYNFGLDSEKVYIPQSLLSNKLTDMPVPSGSSFQPFSKEWWEAAKPNIDLIRKQGGQLPKAQLGTISKALKKTLPFATKFDDVVINSHPFFKTNVLKDPLLQQEMLKRLATGIEPIKNYTGDMLYELISPEGKKRLLKQESEHLEYIGYPKNFIDKQAELNYKARLRELGIMGDVRNSASVASKFLDQNRLPKKGFFNTKYLYSNASYTHPDKMYSDAWAGDINNYDFFNLNKTQLGEKALPGFIRMGVDYTSPFNIPLLSHEIRGHGLQRGRQLQIDRDALKMIKPKKELNENQQNAYSYFKKSGKEPSAYLNELREAMLLKGLIKHRYENITPEKLQVASTFFKRNPMGVVKSNNSKSYLSNTRILDFMEESPEMYQNLSWLLNRLPTLGLGLGAAGAVEDTLEEKKLGGELPKARRGLFTLANLAKPLITGAGSSNKIIQGLSRDIIDKGIDISAVLAPETMKKYAKHAMGLSSGKGDYNIKNFLKDLDSKKKLLEDYKGSKGPNYYDANKQEFIYDKQYTEDDRNLVDLFIDRNDTNFKELRWLLELEGKDALKKYTDYYGPLKSYELRSRIGHKEPLSGFDVLNTTEIANPKIDKGVKNRSKYQAPHVSIKNWDGEGFRIGHNAYKDFNLWKDKLLLETKESKNPDRIIKAYNQIFDRFGDVIPFEVESKGGYTPNFKFVGNPVKPIDDIAGHMAFLRRNSSNNFDLTTRDVWGFHPVDYTKKWGNQKIDPYFKNLAPKLVNKFGKPFILTQTNPLHFDFKKGGQLPKAKYGKWIKYANKLNVKRPLNLNTWKKPIVTGSIVDELGIDVSNLVNATRFDINNLHDINQTRPIDFGTDKLLNSVLNDYPLINSDPLYIDKLAKLSSSNPKANFIMPDFGNSLHPELAYAMKHSPNIKTFSDPDLSWTEFVKNQKSYANGEGLIIKNLEGWDPVNQKDVSLTYNVNEGIMSKVDPIYQTGRFRGHPSRGVNQHNHLLGMTGNYPSIIASGDNIFTSSGKKRWGERTAGKLANDWDYPGRPVTQDWVDKLLGQKKSSNWMSGSPRFANMLDQSFQIYTPLQDKVFMKFIHPKRKLGGQLPKAWDGRIVKTGSKLLSKYLNPPNPITTSKKFLFTPPEELLRTEAAWEMLSKNNAWKQSHSDGFRDRLNQIKSRYDYSKLIRESKSNDKEFWKLLDKKKQGKTENIDDKIDEIQKIKNDLDQRMLDVISDYGNFKLDYSGLPVSRAFNKYGHALGGGQGRIYNNLLNDKEYIKYGKYFGDNNDLQNLINVGKTYNNPLVEAAFPTEAFPVGDSRFVQFMPKLDWKSTPLGISDNDIFNIIKDLSDQGVGIDYSGADNIGGVGDKFGLVDLTYIGKPGERNNAFNVHSDVFIPNRKNPLGSKELINEIREMLAPGTNVRGGTSGPEAINKYGGTVELGDVVDKATMERLKAQGYTFEEI